MLTWFRRFNWYHIIAILIFHALAVFALLHRPHPVDLVLLGATYVLTGLGITVGFHRLLAHRGFQCPAWLRAVLAFIGTAGLQGGPITWCTDHRRHHQVTDREEDPHTPLFGFFYAHLGWMLRTRERQRPERMVKDLLAVPFFRWLDRPIPCVFPAAVVAFACFAIAGVSGVLWGVVLRTVLLWHATWFVNSACHIWGSRPYNTPDHSTNLWWVGLATFGEGWHNNHHAHPRCSFHGHVWWQLDASAIVIRALRRAGLVHDVVGVPGRKAALQPQFVPDAPVEEAAEASLSQAV